MNTSNRVLLLATAWAAASILTVSSHAQTYTWADNAKGQIYLTCPNINPLAWPSNSFWTQSLAYGSNCDNTASVVSQPSNWDPAPPAAIYPGGPGLAGVDVVLGPPANTDIESASVTINHLTLQTNGGLYLGYFGGVTANTVDVQGDAVIHAGGYAGELNIADGGSLTKIRWQWRAEFWKGRLWKVPPRQPTSLAGPLRRIPGRSVP